jgi:hypothetical protein
MTPSPHDQYNHIARAETLQGLRSWCVGLSVLAFALALLAVANTIQNPDTWSSAFHAFAATGAFRVWATWLSLAGLVFLVPALVLTVFISKGTSD